MGSRIPRAGAFVFAGTFFAACLANPIPADEAAAHAGDAPAMAWSPLAGASVPLGGAGRGVPAPDQANAMATARDPALLPIDIQGVGTQAHPTPVALPNGQPGDPAGDDNQIKKFSASARNWMNDVFGRPAAREDNAAGDLAPGTPGAPGDLGLPVEIGASGVQAIQLRAQRPIEVPPPGAGPRRATAAATLSPPTAGARLLAESAPEYSIQSFVRRCREVLVHPLTWLAVVAIGVAHIAMARARR